MIAKCLILHIGMASAMNQSREPQARQANAQKRQTGGYHAASYHRYLVP